MDERTTYVQQLQANDGPVVLMNQFNVAPEDIETFLAVWADDAAFMKRQPSTQLHRGTAGSCTFMNVAVWESAKALGEAFGSPEFQKRAARYPESAVCRATRLREGRRPWDLRGVVGAVGTQQDAHRRQRLRSRHDGARTQNSGGSCGRLLPPALSPVDHGQRLRRRWPGSLSSTSVERNATERLSLASVAAWLRAPKRR